MRWLEVFSDAPNRMTETKTSGSKPPVAPLTPAKMRARQEKRDKAVAHLSDVRAANAARLQAAQRRVADA
jgi:hypothetical protein